MPGCTSKWTQGRSLSQSKDAVAHEWKLHIRDDCVTRDPHMRGIDSRGEVSYVINVGSWFQSAPMKQGTETVVIGANTLW